MLVFCFFLVKANFVLALEQQYPTILGLGIGNGTLPEYAKYFFNIGMAIAGTLAVIVIIFGGIYYLISLGMGKFTDEGKQWVKAGILGLILTVSSYLIAFTINPNLVVFKLDGLLSIPFGNLFSQPPTNTTPFLYYDEIPIGTLTESTLSRTMDCYDYDGNGDPIEGQITIDDNNNNVINGPTLLNHDRVDCFLKLSEAAEKKSKLIKKLSDEIVKLMEQCSCAGKCDNTCNINSSGACGTPIGGKCLTGTCLNKACKPFAGKSNDCCPAGVKNIIEHGPIKIANQDPKFDYSGKDFKGLDEFRTQLTNISNFIEIQPRPKINGKEITIINNGNCQICSNNCLQCNPQDQNCLNKCQNNNATCQNNRRVCLKNSTWGNLKLIEQLMYLKEKMDQIKAVIEQDRGQLVSAEEKLGQCYLAEPYIDFLKTVEKTKKEDKTILAIKTFNDPATQKQIDVYKYCKGFDYANSNSYSQCQNICPETLGGMQDLTCYKNCQQCNEKDPQKQAQCLALQTQCIKVCYDNHKCPAPANTNPPFTTFKECIQGLDQQCSALCDQKYPSLPSPNDELTKCKAKCGNNSSSRCLFENEDKCTVNFPQLKTCIDNYTGSNPKDDDLKSCMNDSSLCRYGSDEYAGYPDCANNQGPYSSSFLYQNPNEQKCKEPYKPYISNINTIQTCVGLYPETAKCPTASKCPKCPCGIINETINYDSGEIGGGGGGGGGGQCPPGTCRGLDGICSPGNCPPPPPSGAGSFSAGSSVSSTTILEYQVVTGTCNESSYNDDPLTFYCQQNWWYKENKVEEKKLTPIGGEKVCSKENEIPVGQTIDNTEKWANELVKNINDFTKTTEDLIQYIRTIVQEQKYCQCDSTCENGLPCSSSCQYVPPVCNGDPPVCSIDYCTVKPCAGIACQKMINLLRGGATANCPVNKDGIFYYYDKIYKESKTFYEFVIADGRTDILKELSYSRKKINEGSTVQSAFGNEAKVLSCERVQDEIISPIKEGQTKINGKTIKSYCYGKNLGQILKTPEPMADNWFYCEERQGIN